MQEKKRVRRDTQRREKMGGGGRVQRERKEDTVTYLQRIDSTD